MTLNEYIKELQALAKDKKLANAELIVSEDDEGNGYRKFSGSPQPVWIDLDSGYYIESVYYEDDFGDNEELNFYKRVILIN